MTTHYLFDTKPYFEGRWKSKWTLLGVYIIWKRREKVLKCLRKNGWKVTLWQWKGIWCISLQCVCDASVFAFCLLQFDSDYEEFKQSIDGLKQQLQMFVDSWFEKPLSVSVFFFTKLPCFLTCYLIESFVVVKRFSTECLHFRVLPRFSFVLASCCATKLVPQECQIFSLDREGSRAPAKIPKHSRSSIVSSRQVPEDSSAVWKVWSH